MEEMDWFGESPEWDAWFEKTHGNTTPERRATIRQVLRESQFETDWQIIKDLNMLADQPEQKKREIEESLDETWGEYQKARTEWWETRRAR